MTDYISREAAVNGLAEIIVKSDMPEDWNKGMSAAVSALFRIPAADVRPVVRAKRGDDWETGCSTCSACGESYLWEDYDGVGEWNFCPNCGAMMEES